MKIKKITETKLLYCEDKKKLRLKQWSLIMLTEMKQPETIPTETKFTMKTIKAN